MKFFKEYKSLIILSLLTCILGIIFIPEKSFCFEPDSQGYIDFVATRSAGYPSFLKTLGLVSTQWQFYSAVQIILSSLVILVLCRELTHWLKNKKIVSLVWVFFALNPILYVLNVKILTEGLFCTLMICIATQSLVYLRKNRSPKQLLLLSLFVGLSISIRPSGLYYLVALIFFLILMPPQRKKLWPAIACLFLPAFFIMGTSKLIYDAHHEKANSLMPAHIFARGLMLMNENDHDLFPDQMKPHLPALLDLKSKVDNLEGFTIRHLARTRLEVMFQHQLDHQMTNQARQDLGIKLIKRHPGAYIKHTSLHFLHLWTGFEVFSKSESDSFAQQNKDWQQLELVNDFSWHDTLTKKRRTFPLAWLHWVLLMPLLMIITSTVLSFIHAIKKTDEPLMRLAGFFSICCIGSSLLTAMVGIATIRYALTVTPFLITIVLLFILSFTHRNTLNNPASSSLL